MNKRELDLIVVSYGGSGCTFLIQFFARLLRVNQWDSFADGIKHANSPDHPILEGYNVKRAIYIYDDPVIAALSVFRRDFQSHVIPKINANHRSPAEYKAYVEANLVNMDLDEYLQNGQDLFHFQQHISHWMKTRPNNFPVMFVKYPVLFDHLPEIFDFLSVPRAYIQHFPAKRARSTKHQEIPKQQYEQLVSMYKPLSDELAKLPPIFTRNIQTEAPTT